MLDNRIAARRNLFLWGGSSTPLSEARALGEGFLLRPTAGPACRSHPLRVPRRCVAAADRDAVVVAAPVRATSAPSHRPCVASSVLLTRPGAPLLRRVASSGEGQAGLYVLNRQTWRHS